MTARILAQHGNVIAADFRPRPFWEVLAVTFSTEILYEDDRLLLTRTTTTFDGKTLAVLTFAGNKATGHIVQL